MLRMHLTATASAALGYLFKTPPTAAVFEARRASKPARAAHTKPLLKLWGSVA